MSMDTAELRGRIKKAIVRSLELEIDAATIGDDTLLFASGLVGGMDLDSLAAIEIVVALANEFRLGLDEVPRESFESVATLGEFIAAKLKEQSAP